MQCQQVWGLELALQGLCPLLQYAKQLRCEMLPSNAIELSPVQRRCSAVQLSAAVQACLYHPQDLSIPLKHLPYL
jgi:hypothetical protein